MSDIKICNPLLRIPLSRIIDDSCPVINKAYYWIQKRHDWRIRHRPNTQPRGWEVHYNRLASMPNTIPADFPSGVNGVVNKESKGNLVLFLFQLVLGV